MPNTLSVVTERSFQIKDGEMYCTSTKAAATYLLHIGSSTQGKMF